LWGSVCSNFVVSGVVSIGVKTEDATSQAVTMLIKVVPTALLTIAAGY
jgi:hypothetical protein